MKMYNIVDIAGGCNPLLEIDGIKNNLVGIFNPIAKRINFYKKINGNFYKFTVHCVRSDDLDRPMIKERLMFEALRFFNQPKKYKKNLLKKYEV